MPSAPQPPPSSKQIKETPSGNSTFSLRVNYDKPLPSVANYRISSEQQSWLHDKVRDLQRQGLIEPRTIKPRILSPINLVKKEGGGWRFTNDFKPTVNKVTEQDTHPLPKILPILQRLSRFRYFGKIDLVNGFWNMKTRDEATKDLLGFEVPGLGYYVWTCLAQGLKQGPSLFQHYFEDILSGLDVDNYLDDVPFGADTLEEFYQIRDRILKRCREHSLTINEDKSILDPVESLPALGFTTSYHSVTPTDDYISSLRDFEITPSKQSLRKWLGKLSAVGQAYPGIQPLKNVLFAAINHSKASASWHQSSSAHQAIASIKALLSQPQALGHLPVNQDPVRIFCDAGDTGFAARLLYKDSIIGTLARKYPLTSLPQLSPTIRELYGVTQSLIHWQDTLFNRPVEINCDHQALVALWTKPRHQQALVARMIESVSHLSDQLIWLHVPRSDPQIKIVDAMGRFPSRARVGTGSVRFSANHPS